MSPLASAVSGVFGLVNDSFNRSHNAEEARKNREFQRQERLETQQFNLDMWNMSNDYNDLESQVERAVDAGFSPNAILEGAGDMSKPVTSTPMAGAQSSFQSQMSPVLANLAKTIAETALIKNQAKGQALTNEFDARTMESRVEIIDKNVEGLATTIKKDLASIEKLKVETDTLKEAFKYIAPMSEAELSIKLETINNLRAQHEKIIADILNTYKSTAKTVAETEHVIGSNKLQQQEYARNELMNPLEIKSAENNLKLQGEQYEGDVLDNLDKKLRAELSVMLGVPSGTPEHELLYMLYLTGKLPQYIRDVRTPLNQSSWKPSDFAVPATNYDFNFKPWRGTASPQYKGTTWDKLERVGNNVRGFGETVNSLIPDF